MSLFQKSVLNKYYNELSIPQIQESFLDFQFIFNNPAKQQNILNAKEEQYQEGFLRELFVKILGYTLYPDGNHNLITEQKNETNSKKADGAILNGLNVIAVIELKSTKTVDLASIESQAFGYKNNQQGCKYVITSNFKKLRFYIDNAVEFLEFDLFNLNFDDFKLLWVCLSANYLLKNIPAQIKEASNHQEERITKQLYADYARFRTELFNDICAKNTDYDRLFLFKKTQKLLDRFLFLFFAEDRGLVSPNWTRKILQDWTDLKDKYDNYIPLYTRFRKNFDYLNTGYHGKDGEIFAYNGGLFAPDEVLDNLTVDDDLLYKGSLKLSNYDFDSEVDVNILGHIFENSLNEIDEIHDSLNENKVDKVTKRKEDGVFYTPKYITKYIVENTIGTLCKEQKEKLEIIDEDFEFIEKGKKKKKREELNKKIIDYRAWLLELKIIDPACGSGAFLNQALEFLIAEHTKLDELRARLLGGSIVLSDVETSILENNLYGVDINDEAVEIAKLSLWLRTARKGRKLNSLNNNLKCGNSLIDDVEVAGDKAFNWNTEFKEVFDKGGFDVVIGNPPYGIFIDEIESNYYSKFFPLSRYKINLYVLFIERMFQVFKTKTLISFIIPKSLLFNSYYDNIREHLIKNTSIKEFLTISDKVFVDAEVGGSLIITYNNYLVSDRLTNFVSLKSFFDSKWQTQSINQAEYLKVPNCEISFSRNETVHLKSRLLKMKVIKDFFLLKNGLNPGNIKDKLISTEKVTDNYEKIIWGKDIGKYEINWSGSFINYDESIQYSSNDIKSKKGMNSQISVDYALRTKDLFETPKVVVRKTGDSLISAVDLNNNYFDTLVHGIYSKTQEVVELKSLSALLNSKPATYFYRLLHDIKGKVFAKISLDNLKSFPIPDLYKLVESNLRLKYDEIIFLKNELKVIDNRFLKFIVAEFQIMKQSPKLKKWISLEYKQFDIELSKVKADLKIKEKADLYGYFEEQKNKALAIKMQIEQIDMEIDQMVYELYELTEEEIKIMEGI